MKLPNEDPALPRLDCQIHAAVAEVTNRRGRVLRAALPAFARLHFTPVTTLATADADRLRRIAADVAALADALELEQRGPTTDPPDQLTLELANAEAET